MKIELPGAIRQSNGVWTKIVELAEMTGRDEDILADATINPKTKSLKVSMGERLTQVLSRCTVAIGDERRPDGVSVKQAPLFFQKHWEGAFIPDRHFATVRLRQISVIDGDTFSFYVQCPHCGHQPDKRAVVDLNSLSVKSIPLAAFDGDGGFTFLLPSSGREVEWKHLVGSQETVVDELRTKKAGSIMTEMLKLRISKIDGDPSVTYDAVSSLSKKDLQALREELVRHDFGLDMDLTTTCPSPECGKDFTDKIPVGSPDFFFPQGAS